jgi:hypothetical protein
MNERVAVVVVAISIELCWLCIMNVLFFVLYIIKATKYCSLNIFVVQFIGPLLSFLVAFSNLTLC